MEELVEFSKEISTHDFPLLWFLVNSLLVLGIAAAVVTLFYDRYIQRENQLLINYPLIGRLRYLFYALRDPMRQYFGDEKFFDSFDKVKWVYNAAQKRMAYTSFSPEQPLRFPYFKLKNANRVLNEDEVSCDFHVMFGSYTVKQPFEAVSCIMRSGMSDGAISPEATRAFAKGAFLGGFPINTGEGGLTSNFLYTHRYKQECSAYLDVARGSWFARSVYRLIRFFLNPSIAKSVYKHMILDDGLADTYLFDEMVCYRINWNAPLEAFPKEVPQDLPDIVFQMGSALYGVRNKQGDFDAMRYEKVMRFCCMTEIKIAQGAKQTGGRLPAKKVTPAVAYYRGVRPYEELVSPNRFPYAGSLEELFDFIDRLKTISKKPVGIKIVLASKESFKEYAALIAKRIKEGSNAYPDFITIDGGEGGSGAAPLEMMMRVGLGVEEAVFWASRLLEHYGVRSYVRLVASSKVLTPDDVVVLEALGADMVAIARAFMMSAGCIRARECSGAGGRDCPVGLATQNPSKRASFLVEQKARHVASYHEQLKNGVRRLLAVMAKRNIGELCASDLSRVNENGREISDPAHFFT